MSDALAEALATLRAAVVEFEHEIPPAPSDPVTRLKKLREVVASIGYDLPSKPLRSPDESLRQWADYVGGRRTVVQRHALRALCWEPQIATDLRFYEYLAKAAILLPPRWLQGLVASAHQRWSQELIDGDVGRTLRHYLNRYIGPNQRILDWQRDLAIVAGGQGPTLLARRILSDLRPIAEVAEKMGFYEDSAFMRQALIAAMAICVESVTAGSPYAAVVTNELLRWKHWEARAFKEQLAACIVSPQAARLDELQEGLKRVALDTLGDPRLPPNAGQWVGVPPGAKAELVKWLSRQDIEFFFQLALPRGADPHGRKDFWLKYVDKVKRSRPILCPDDELKLRAVERQSHQKLGLHGRIKGTTSAFLLDFGGLLVIEFSVKGNACYIYDQPHSRETGIERDFWQEKGFLSGELRSSKAEHINKVSTSFGAWRVTHVQSGIWRQNLAGLLASYGIRPGQ